MKINFELTVEVTELTAAGTACPSPQEITHMIKRRIDGYLWIGPHKLNVELIEEPLEKIPEKDPSNAGIRRWWGMAGNMVRGPEGEVCEENCCLKNPKEIK